MKKTQQGKKGFVQSDKNAEKNMNRVRKRQNSDKMPKKEFT